MVDSSRYDNFTSVLPYDEGISKCVSEDVIFDLIVSSGAVGIGSTDSAYDSIYAATYENKSRVSANFIKKRNRIV